MSTWTAPSAVDVLSEFTAQEQATINTLQGGTNNLATILGRVVSEIRSYIAAGGYASDAGATTLPKSLYNDAIAITRWRFLISVPNLKQFQTDARKDANDESIAKLRLVASRKFAVEPPDDSAPDLGGGFSEVIGDRPRLATRETMSAL